MTSVSDTRAALLSFFTANNGRPLVPWLSQLTLVCWWDMRIARRMWGILRKWQSVVLKMTSESKMRTQDFLRHCKVYHLHSNVCLINRSKLHSLIVCNSFLTTTTCAKWCVWCKLNAQSFMCVCQVSIKMLNRIECKLWKKTFFLNFHFKSQFDQNKLLFSILNLSI